MTAKEENLPLLEWVQEHGSCGTDQYFEYILSIGEKNEFQVRLKGGQLGNSEPEEMLSELADYTKINIQIFESSRGESKSLDNLDVRLDVWRKRASPVYPSMDDRFSGQPWAQNWDIAKSLVGKSSMVSYLMASPDTICDIIRYCQRLVGLKVFW
jgi:hypothetical protein